MPRLVDEHRRGPAEIGEVAHEDRPRRPDEGVVVDPEEDHLPEDAVGAPGPGHPLVEAHRPVHPLHPADPVDGTVGDRLDLVGVLLVAVGDPHARLADIPEGVGGAAHEADEDRCLLGDEEHPEGDAEHGAEILGGVAVEHLPGDPVHRGTVFLVPADGAADGPTIFGPRPSAASEKRVM